MNLNTAIYQNTLLLGPIEAAAAETDTHGVRVRLSATDTACFCHLTGTAPFSSSVPAVAAQQTAPDAVASAKDPLLLVTRLQLQTGWFLFWTRCGYRRWGASCSGVGWLVTVGLSWDDQLCSTPSLIPELSDLSRVAKVRESQIWLRTGHLSHSVAARHRPDQTQGVRSGVYLFVGGAAKSQLL